MLMEREVMIGRLVALLVCYRNSLKAGTFFHLYSKASGKVFLFQVLKGNSSRSVFYSIHSDSYLMWHGGMVYDQLDNNYYHVERYSSFSCLLLDMQNCAFLCKWKRNVFEIIDADLQKAYGYILLD